MFDLRTLLPVAVSPGPLRSSAPDEHRTQDKPDRARSSSASDEPTSPRKIRLRVDAPRTWDQPDLSRSGLGEVAEAAREAGISVSDYADLVHHEAKPRYVAVDADFALQRMPESESLWTLWKRQANLKSVVLTLLFFAALLAYTSSESWETRVAGVFLITAWFGFDWLSRALTQRETLRRIRERLLRQQRLAERHLDDDIETLTRQVSNLQQPERAHAAALHLAALYDAGSLERRTWGLLAQGIREAREAGALTQPKDADVKSSYWLSAW